MVCFAVKSIRNVRMVSGQGKNVQMGSCSQTQLGNVQSQRTKNAWDEICNDS